MALAQQHALFPFTRAVPLGRTSAMVTAMVPLKALVCVALPDPLNDEAELALSAAAAIVVPAMAGG
jgi:hypothetical protein